MPPPKKIATRDAIISTALEQAVVIGLEGISLGGVAAAVGMSKSGLFAHFKSKNELQLSIIDAALNLFQMVVLAPAMKSTKGMPRLRALYRHYLDWMAGSSGLATCPFTVFIQEYDGRPGAIRDLLVKEELRWRETFSKVASEAILSEKLPNSLNPAQITFELIGAAFSYQVSHGLLAEKNARQHALSAFDRVFSKPA